MNKSRQPSVVYTDVSTALFLPATPHSAPACPPQVDSRNLPPRHEPHLKPLWLYRAHLPRMCFAPVLGPPQAHTASQAGHSVGKERHGQGGSEPQSCNTCYSSGKKRRRKKDKRGSLGPCPQAASMWFLFPPSKTSAHAPLSTANAMQTP